MISMFQSIRQWWNETARPFLSFGTYPPPVEPIRTDSEPFRVFAALGHHVATSMVPDQPFDLRYFSELTDDEQTVAFLYISLFDKMLQQTVVLINKCEELKRASDVSVTP